MSGKFTVYRQSNAQVCGPNFTASATLDRVFERFSLSYAQLDYFQSSPVLISDSCNHTVHGFLYLSEAVLPTYINDAVSVTDCVLRLKLIVC